MVHTCSEVPAWHMMAAEPHFTTGDNFQSLSELHRAQESRAVDSCVAERGQVHVVPGSLSL